MSDDDAAFHRIQNENFYLRKVLDEALETIRFYEDSRNYTPPQINCQSQRDIRGALEINHQWRSTKVITDWGEKARNFLVKNRKWFVRLGME